MTDVDEESSAVPTKEILDLDSPLENDIITTKDDVTYINMDPVPLSMLEVIDESDTSASIQQKVGDNLACDEEKVLLVKVAPDPMSMLEVSEGTDFGEQPNLRNGSLVIIEDGNVLGTGLWSPSNATFIGGVQLYTCFLCGESYPTHDELKDHVSIHSLENSFGNRPFNSSILEGSGCVQAIKTSKSDQFKHSCNLCSRTFPQLSSLKKHMKVHSGKKPFICSECGKVYTEITYLKKHILTHAGNNQNNFCSICNSKFNNIASLRQHMQMHASNINPNSCMICGKTFTRLAVLKKHVMLQHTCHIAEEDEEEGDMNGEEENLERDEERAETKTKAETLVSMKRHICSTCSKAFNSQGNLQRHLRIHTGEKPYVCSICGTSFSQLSHLRQHHQTHTDDKLECPVCGVFISNDRNFKRHMKLHTGERPFKCETCCATFTQQTHLKKHSKTHNNTEYKCSTCNVSQPDLNEYKQHMRQHAGQKPYACSICDASFSDINLLREHVETHSTTQINCSDKHDYIASKDVHNFTIKSEGHGGKIMKDCSVQADCMEVGGVRPTRNSDINSSAPIQCVTANTKRTEQSIGCNDTISNTAECKESVSNRLLGVVS